MSIKVPEVLEEKVPVIVENSEASIIGKEVEEVSKAQDPIDRIRSIFVTNPLLWGGYYFHHHFRDPSPDFHLKIIKECLNNRYVAFQAPRESAKSTMASFLYPTHCITYKRKKFIVIVQNTYAKSKETLNTIKEEFKNNYQFKKDYGIKIFRDMEGDSIIIHPDGFKTRILCKGAEQIGSVRGEKFGAYRPDLIIIDDLEDDDMVRNPERRRVLQSLFDDALVPAGDRQNCQYIAIGTILHDDCLMAKLVSPDHYKEYRKLFYIAKYYNKMSKKEMSLWPEKWTLDDLCHLEKTKPDVFAKEYQGDPVSGSLRKFDKEDFRRWYIEEDHYVLLDGHNKIYSKGKLSDCRAAIGCDLAWDEKREADFTVVIPVFLTPNSDILVDNYFCEKGVRPDQFEEILFTMERRLKNITNKLVYVAMEKGKLEKVMKWCMKQAMKRRNHFLNFKDISWTQDKIARIVTPLQPRYKMHSIFHKSEMGELEYQLMRIPAGTHDDLPDGLQMAVRSLEYAPKMRTVATDSDYDEGFEFLRKSVIARKNPKKKSFVFGNKAKKWARIPARVSWR